MLVAQAEASFELWTGHRPPAGVMERAVRAGTSGTDDRLGRGVSVGLGIGPAVDGWITRQLAHRGLGRPAAWRPATRWMLSVTLGAGWAGLWLRVGWTGVLPAHLV